MTTIPTTTTDYEPLHFLRIKGCAGDQAFAHMLGVQEDTALAVSRALVAEGLAARKESPRLSGTLLTSQGRVHHAELLRDRLSDPAYRDGLTSAFEAFRELNGRFKRICVRWQGREDGSPNLHDDAEYDAAVVADLGVVDAEARELLGTIVVEPRLTRYGDRLRVALDRLRAGERAAFLRPMSESYHDVWMELHEDLILSAGRQRDASDEG